MNPFLWMLVGAGGLSLLGTAVMLVLEREYREAVGQALLGLVVLPAAFIAWALRAGWAPRVVPLSNRALELISKQVASDRQKAWAFAYLNHGVILVRRTKDAGSRNRFAERATDAKRVTDR